MIDIVLTEGNGTRLHPITKRVPTQLFPMYNNSFIP